MKRHTIALIISGFVALGTGCKTSTDATPPAKSSENVETKSNGDAKPTATAAKKAGDDAKPDVHTRISGKEARKLVAMGAKIVDVRTPGEFASGHVEGAVNIPVGDLAGRMGELKPDEEIVVYCRSGARSSRAMGMLKKAGYATVWDMGPFSAW